MLLELAAVVGRVVLVFTLESSPSIGIVLALYGMTSHLLMDRLGLHTVKLLLVYVGSLGLLSEQMSHSYFYWTILFNVAVLAVPELYDREFVKAFLLLWCAYLTPKNGSHSTFVTAYLSVIIFWKCTNECMKDKRVWMLCIDLPMLISHLLGRQEDVWTQRAMAHVVILAMSNPWSLSTPLPPHPFRSLHRHTSWNTLSDLLHATDSRAFEAVGTAWCVYTLYRCTKLP